MPKTTIDAVNSIVMTGRAMNGRESPQENCTSVLGRSCLAWLAGVRLRRFAVPVRLFRLVPVVVPAVVFRLRHLSGPFGVGVVRPTCSAHLTTTLVPGASCNWPG